MRRFSKVIYKGHPALVKKVSGHITEILVYFEGIWIEETVNTNCLIKRKQNISDIIYEERIKQFNT